LPVSGRQYGCGQGFRSVPALATQHREAAAAINRFLEELSLCMHRHPDLRQCTAESAKWARWRRVRFQRPFSRSMGSAAFKAIVSGFLSKSPTAGAHCYGVRNCFHHPIETIAPESSPFDISVMKPLAWCFGRDSWFHCFPEPFLDLPGHESSQFFI
jgi:hypothetical protein